MSKRQESLNPAEKNSLRGEWGGYLKKGAAGSCFPCRKGLGLVWHSRKLVMVMRLYRKGGWGFRRPATWIESIKIPSIVALRCSQWLPGSVCDHLWWSNPSDALPAHAEYPRPVPPGRARSWFGESRGLTYSGGTLFWNGMIDRIDIS